MMHLLHHFRVGRTSGLGYAVCACGFTTPGCRTAHAARAAHRLHADGHPDWQGEGAQDAREVAA